MKEKFQRRQTVNVFKDKCNTEGYNLYNNNSTVVPPIQNFSLAGNIIVYKPNQGTNREKYFIHIIYKGKNAESRGKQTPLRPFLPSWTASFPSFDGKSTGTIRQKWTSKSLFPCRRSNNINKRSNRFSIRGN